MNSLVNTPLFFLAFQCVVVACLLLALYRIRTVFGLGLLYVTLGLFKYLHFFLTKSFSLELADGLRISLGSSVLFTGVLFAVLLIYIRESSHEARKVIYALFAVNFVFVVVQYLIILGLDQPGIKNFYHFQPSFFAIPPRMFWSGSGLVLLDSFLIVFSYDQISRKIPSLFLRILSTMALVLFVHALLFALGSQAGTGRVQRVFISGLASKAIPLLIYSSLFWCYLIFIEKRQGEDPIRRGGVKEVFNLLTYERKFEEVSQKQQLTETELQQSERRFRTIFNTINDAIFIQHPANGKILDVNARGVEMLGFSRAELQRLDVGAISSGVHPYTNMEAAVWIRRCTLTEPQTFEWQLKPKKGALFWGEINMRRTVMDGEERLIVSLRNIDDRKAAEAALKESEAHYSDLYENAPDMYVSVDAETGLIRECNQTLVEKTGFTKAEIVGRSIFEMYHPVGLEKVKQTFAVFKASGNVKNAELQLQKKDGGKIEVILNVTSVRDETGKIIHSRSSWHDITEIKKAEEELKRSNLELKTLNKIISASAGMRDVKSLMKTAMDEVLAITGLEGGTVCRVTDEQVLHLVVEKNASEETKNDLQTHVIKVGDCLCGNCASENKPLILWTREEVLKYSSRESLRNEAIKFHAAFPIITREKARGVLCVFTYTDKKPTERSLKLIETLTNQLALPVENASLYETISRQVEELQQEILERKEIERELEQHRKQLEKLVSERTAELEKKNAQLERLNKHFVGRELRMVELKQRIAELEEQSHGA